MKPNRAKDRQLLQAIEQYWREHGYAPSLRDIKLALAYPSHSTVYARIVRLRQTGLLTWDPGRSRTLRLTVPDGGEERTNAIRLS